MVLSEVEVMGQSKHPQNIHRLRRFHRDKQTELSLAKPLLVHSYLRNRRNLWIISSSRYQQVATESLLRIQPRPRAFETTSCSELFDSRLVILVRVFSMNQFSD